MGNNDHSRLEKGKLMKLPTNTTSGRTNVETETVYVHHGHAPVYNPAPEGGQYCDGATCTHNHPDTDKGYAAARECSERLARIIESGRLPNWATLDSAARNARLDAERLAR